MTLRPPLLSGPVQLEELPRFFSAPFAPSLACQILGVINTAAMKTATRQSKVMSLASPAASMRKPPLSQGVGNDGPRLRRRSAGRVDAGAKPLVSEGEQAERDHRRPGGGRQRGLERVFEGGRGGAERQVAGQKRERRFDGERRVEVVVGFGQSSLELDADEERHEQQRRPSRPSRPHDALAGSAGTT